jgi:PAS domain S-box-containing protein
MAWGTVALIFLVLNLGNIPRSTYRSGLVVLGALAVWLIFFFHVLLFRRGNQRWIARLGVVVDIGFAAVMYWLLRDVPSSQLIFVPVILATGLIASFKESITASLLAVAAYVGFGYLDPPLQPTIPLIFNSIIFLLSGSVAGLLAHELRAHFRGEQKEQQAAITVRHRLFAVLDTVDEAIVYRDREGVARVINQKAGALFGVKPEDYIGRPVIELLRRVARETEDPEDFIETFQQLRDDPELEFRVELEQIIPVRRRLKLYSGPTRDDDDALVGRIDVYTDITEAVRRAAEVERLYEEARRTAESYQRGLLPQSSPSLPRLSMVAHYVPAAGRRAICGDFYDYITLPDGRVAVVLGDVCGIGPEAATDAALTRYTLRSFAAQESDPAVLLDQMNPLILKQTPNERFVRLLIGVLDPERAVFHYANAGHVPPVLYRAKEDRVDWLAEGGIVLGVEENASYKTARMELTPGDMLVFYTDGVTEASREGRPYGQGKFGDVVKQYGVGTPGELAQALRRSVEAWVSVNPNETKPEGTLGELRDDIAIVVCQVAPDRMLGEPARELVLPNEPARVAEARAFVSRFLTDLRTPVDTATEIELAVGEAAANAYRHGKRSGRSEMRIYCSLEGPSVAISVADDGGGFDPREVAEREPPDRFASGGRGLFLMKELMDEVEIDSSDQGTTITMYRRINRPHPHG